MTVSLTVDLESVSKTTAAALAACFASIAGSPITSASSAAPSGSDRDTTVVTKPVVDTSTAIPPSASTAPGVDQIAAKYFPDNIGLAAFPSPENSSVVRLGSLITGRPYLRDNSGNVHQFVQPTTDCPNGYIMNGQPVRGGGSDGDPASSLLVRTGEVYVNVRGNIWQHISSGGLYTATLPAAFQTDASGATTSTLAVSSVVAPPDPPASAVAPGGSGKVLEVGSGKAFTTITAAFTAALAGDTVHLAAETYKETPPATLVPLYVKADKGALLDCTGLTTLARQKGGIVPAADMTIEGLEIIGAGMMETEAGGTAAVRPDLGCNYLTLINCNLHDNQNGVACGDVPVIIVFDGGSYDHNGLPDGTPGHGYTHNVYASHGTLRVETKNGAKFTNPNGGHAFKTRAYQHLLSDSVFVGGLEAAVIDVPNGSTKCILTNVTITKPAGAYNHSIIDYATDDASCGNSGMQIVNSSIQALCDNPFMLIGSGSQITVDAATKAKTTGAITAQGGTLVGL